MKNIESQNNIFTPTESTKEITTNFKNEVTRTFNNNPNFEIPSSTDLYSYVKLLIEFHNFYSNTDLDINNIKGSSEEFSDIIDIILPDNLVESLFDDITERNNLKEIFPPARKIHIAALPFDNFGLPLNLNSTKTVTPKDYICNLQISNSDLSKGFSSTPSYIHKLLPDSLTNSFFITPQVYDYDDLHNVTENDIMTIKNLYTSAFMNLKSSLKNSLDLSLY